MHVGRRRDAIHEALASRDFDYVIAIFARECTNLDGLSLANDDGGEFIFSGDRRISCFLARQLDIAHCGGSITFLLF